MAMAATLSTDPLAVALIRAVDKSLTRDLAEQRVIRDEIHRRGTAWAAEEIWRLRRTLARQLKKERS